MLKKIVLLAVAAATMCSCKISDGDTVKRTAPGYIMYNNTISGYNQLSLQLKLAFQIDEYIAASTDEERKTVHNKYFYSQYVEYNAETGIFNVRYPQNELFVDTGGKLLSEDGAVWRGHYTVSDPHGKKEGFPTFTRLENGNYKVEYSVAQYSGIPSADISVEMTIEEPQSVLDSRIVKFSGNSKSEYVSSGDGSTFVIDAEVSDLTWDGSTFIGGRFAMTTTNDGITDTVSATIIEPMTVEIEYRGVKEKYSGYYYY